MTIPRKYPNKIGGKNRKMHNFENENTKVVGYVGYNAESRDHMWLALCKHCGQEKESTVSTLATRKSCGCKSGRAPQPKDPWDYTLAREWLRKSLC